MTITREDLNPVTIQLTVVCDADEVAHGYDRAYKKLNKQMKLPGFRPGHIPKNILEERVPKQQLREEAAEEIVRSQYKKAFEAEGLEPDPTVRPSVDIKVIEDDKCEFIAKVPLKPIIELGEYKGLPIQKPDLAVSPEEVEYQLQELRNKKGMRQAVTDRGIQEGDVAVVNIKLEGSDNEGRNFMLIAGQTFPGMDEILSGMRVEEMKAAKVSFPENFQEKDWAGQELEVQVRINSLSTVSLPDLDDDFAQSLKTDNVEDLKAKVEAGIYAAKSRMLDEMVHEQLMEALLSRSTIHVSDNMWEPIVAQRLRDIAEEQHREGKNLQQYAEENGMTLESMVESLKHQAKIHIQRALMIREIFTREKMQVTNQELNDELRRMAAEFGVHPMELVDVLQKNGQMEELSFRALSRKVTDFLADNAEVSVLAPGAAPAPATSAEPAAEKPAKKRAPKAKAE